MVRLLAAVMAAVNASAWVVVSRWESPGKTVRHRVRLRAPRLIGQGFDVGLYSSLGLSVVLISTGRWWANAEERLLASSEGFGDAYRSYAARTGRFVPRIGPRRGDDGSVVSAHGRAGGSVADSVLRG